MVAARDAYIRPTEGVFDRSSARKRTALGLCRYTTHSPLEILSTGKGDMVAFNRHHGFRLTFPACAAMHNTFRLTLFAQRIL